MVIQQESVKDCMPFDTTIDTNKSSEKKQHFVFPAGSSISFVCLICAFTFVFALISDASVKGFSEPDNLKQNEMKMVAPAQQSLVEILFDSVNSVLHLILTALCIFSCQCDHPSTETAEIDSI